MMWPGWLSAWERGWVSGWLVWFPLGQQVPHLLLGASVTEPLQPWKACLFLHRELHSFLSLLPQALPLKGGPTIPGPVPRQGPPPRKSEAGWGRERLRLQTW